MVAKMHSRSGSKGFSAGLPSAAGPASDGATGSGRDGSAPEAPDRPRTTCEGDGPAAMRRASASPVMSGRRWAAAAAARAGWWQC